MKKEILQALKKVLDPETLLNIVDMGLIYNIKTSKGKVTILMTLTTPLCPYGAILKSFVIEEAKKVKGVKEVLVELTFTPLWTSDKISKAARLLLGW